MDYIHSLRKQISEIAGKVREKETKLLCLGFEYLMLEDIDLLKDVFLFENRQVNSKTVSK